MPEKISSTLIAGTWLGLKQNSPSAFNIHKIVQRLSGPGGIDV
jgi:hypothetical protein